MQLQGASELEHDFRGEVSYFFDQSDFVHGPSLVDHDFRPCFQPPAAGGDLHLKGVNPGDFGRNGGNGDNGRMGVVEVVGNDHGRSGFFRFRPQGGVEINQKHFPPFNRGRH